MKRLKELRLQINYTQEELADHLGVSQQTIARWESRKAEPNLKALRDIAVFFGTSVDDLLETAPAKIRTNHYLYSHKGNQDSFWGHLGLMLPNQQKSTWFPITGDETDRLMRNLDGTDSGWLTVSTLNNRLLVFNPKQLKRIVLIDDNDDQIKDDWKLRWDGYQGYSPEIYKALKVRLLGGYEDKEFHEEYSESIRKIVETLIEEHNIDNSCWESLLIHTHVHHVDDTTNNFWAEPEDLIQISSTVEDYIDEILCMRNFGGGKYFYFPTSAVILIDMPLVEVVEEDNRQLKSLEDSTPNNAE